MKQIPGCILLVDDEQLNLDMLSRRLIRSGFTVEVAASGTEALERVRRQSFDLILLDQMMPEMSGEEVLRQLREEFSREALPIVMVTAVAESDKIAIAIEAGANDYITKPVDYQVALARIRSQLTRKHAEDALRQSEERYALAAHATGEGVWDWNLVTGEVYYSPRWKEMLGVEMPGLNDQRVENTIDGWLSRIVAEDLIAVAEALEAYRYSRGDQPGRLECSYRMRDASGAVHWMECRGVVSRDEHGWAVRMAGTQTDVTDEKLRDALTGMPNRLQMLGFLEAALAARTKAGVDVGAGAVAGTHAVLFLDLDGFKAVNDSMGHAAGDQLLIGIARRLLLLTHDSGVSVPASLEPVAARMGGDEFAILLPAATTATLATFAENIQEIMKIPFELEGQTVYCAFSIGGALAIDRLGRPEEILRDADIAMYIAKRKGRGEYAIFETRMRDEAVQQLDLESDIRTAVERGELELFYQPKVNLETSRTYGVEALLRWNHPTRGLLQPGSFIPAAEDTGAIVGIGQWIRGEACRQVRAWHALFPMWPPLELSINLSPREFRQNGLAEQISDTLRATAFPPSSLHLEITESSLFEDLTAARATLHALKGAGISLDIDDFGSGYSSLSYLRELPFDLLKIDRYFTGSLDPEKPSSSRLIESILALARNLGLQVVAEGIETPQHSRTLRDLGCLLGQGYLYSEPIRAAAMQTFLSLEQDRTAPAMRSQVPLPQPLLPLSANPRLRTGTEVHPEGALDPAAATVIATVAACAR